MNEEDMRKITDAIGAVAKEVHDTKSSVNELHKRQNAADQRLETLTKDHLQLRDSINSISSEVRIMDRIAQVEKDKNNEIHNTLGRKIEDVRQELRENMGEIRRWQEGFMDKFDQHDKKEVADRSKLMYTLLGLLGAAVSTLGVLLYQTLSADLKAVKYAFNSFFGLS